MTVENYTTSNIEDSVVEVASPPGTAPVNGARNLRPIVTGLASMLSLVALLS